MGTDDHRADAAPDAARPVVVIGAAGQLGEAMTVTTRAAGRTIALTRADLDLARTADVRRMLAELQPAAIINCTGYNNVDGAEDHAAEALSANALAVRTLADVAGELEAVLVHYSTDFIFDGAADQPYTETSAPRPQSVYAASKLLGEWFAQEAPAHYVLRVESLFGGLTRLKSSLDTIIARLATGVPVRVFTDRVVSPSYVWDVAEATASLLRLRPPFGIYHCVNSGHATWHDVAVAAARQLGTPALVEPITLAEVNLRASRPRYCALSNDKLRAAGIPMPTWQDALAREVARRSSPASH